jgi:osmotically inducible lipoprotein OsmB
MSDAPGASSRIPTRVRFLLCWFPAVLVSCLQWRKTPARAAGTRRVVLGSDFQGSTPGPSIRVTAGRQACADRPKPSQEKSMKKLMTASVSALLVAALSGCAGMSTQDKRTAVGAAAGGAAGHAISGGSTLGTVGGAVVGGAVGHEWDRIRK